MGRGGLRLKFILLISSVLLAIFALTAYFLIRNVRTSLNNNINQESKAFASLATKPIGDTYSLYQDSGTERIRQEMDKFLDLDPNVSNITIVDIAGNTLFSRETSHAAKTDASTASSFEASYVANKQGEIIRVVQPYLNDNGQHGQAMIYDISTAGVEKDISRQELDVVIFAILGLLLSALATYEFINYFFLRPIQQVSQMSSVIAGGYYSQQIELKRKDEIGYLAQSVNRMAQSLKDDIAKLQESDKLKNEFIMITSHNLRTPLMIIEGNVTLLKDMQNDEQAKHVVNAIEVSARRLNIFSEQMLTIANIEGGERLTNFNDIKIGEITAPLVEEFQQLAAEKHLTFTTELLNQDSTIKANKIQLVGALRNLLDNALKFTAENGTVELQAKLDGDKARFKVRDNGIGIKAEEIPKLFTKFHRGTDVMTYNYEGTGIGLYVAKLIVEQHGGKLTAESLEGQGSTFTVELPVNGPDTGHDDAGKAQSLA